MLVFILILLQVDASCIAVEVDIKPMNDEDEEIDNAFAYWSYCMSLISNEAPNIDKTTAVITLVLSLIIFLKCMIHRVR